MRPHQRRRLRAFIGAGLCLVVAVVLGANVGPSVREAEAASPGTDSAGMLLVSMVGTIAMVVIVATALIFAGVTAKPGRRWCPAPGWPPPPSGWEPPRDWVPDPAWPPAPHDWQWWRGEG